MIPRLFACFLLVFSTSLASPDQTRTTKPEAPVKASVCQLKTDPAAYEHKLVEVSGFAMTGGREDFGLFDLTCPDDGSEGVHLKFGGDVIEDIKTRSVDDARSARFSDLVYGGHGNSVAHATIVGHFFASKPVRYESGVVRNTRNILAIERVVSVDPHRSKAFDYTGQLSNDEPEDDHAGCGYTEMTETYSGGGLLKAQEKAERGEDGWTFTNPRRVASNGLAKLLTIDENSIKLKLKRRAPGRFVYEWRPKKDGDYYVAVVTRPYVLSFYAKNPNRVTWFLRAAFEAGCGNDKQDRRIN